MSPEIEQARKDREDKIREKEAHIEDIKREHAAKTTAAHDKIEDYKRQIAEHDEALKGARKLLAETRDAQTKRRETIRDLKAKIAAEVKEQKILTKASQNAIKMVRREIDAHKKALKSHKPGSGPHSPSYKRAK